MNLSFKGGIKLGVHGLPPVKPARASLKREPNRVNAARDVNNGMYRSAAFLVFFLAHEYQPAVILALYLR